MRRRTLRAIRRAGLIAPALMAVAAHAQSGGPAAKDHRAAERVPTVARAAPTPGDVAPPDPVAAAFDLFAAGRDASRTEDRPPTAGAPPPPAAVIADVEPGVVTVTRAGGGADDPPSPVPVEMLAPAPVAAIGAGLAYAVPEVSTPVDRVRAEPGPAAAGLPRPVDVPVPRRRPAVGEGAMRLASPEPATPVEATVAPVAAAPIAAEGVFGEPRKIPDAAKPYMAVIRREAAANKVPLWLAVGVGWVESKYQPSLRGTHGVVGLMQVMPSTARFQGYRGPTEKLLEPETNIVWGMRELGWTWKEARGDACLAIAKYKGGIRTRSISQAAKDYCARAKAVTGMG